MVYRATTQRNYYVFLSDQRSTLPTYGVVNRCNNPLKTHNTIIIITHKTKKKTQKIKYKTKIYHNYFLVYHSRFYFVFYFIFYLFLLFAYMHAFDRSRRVLATGCIGNYCAGLEQNCIDKNQYIRPLFPSRFAQP